MSGPCYGLECLHAGLLLPLLVPLVLVLRHTLPLDKILDMYLYLGLNMYLDL